MTFTSTKQFDKQFKKLSKKYRTLSEDIVVFHRLFKRLVPVITQRQSKHHVILHSDSQSNLFVIKSRLQCRALKGSSLRVVYVFDQELSSVTMLEIYFKGDRPREDESLWKTFLKK